MLKYIANGINIPQIIPAENAIPTNNTKYQSPADITLQKAKGIDFQKQKVDDIVSAKIAQKLAAEKARLESLAMKNKRLLHEKEIIKEALKISAQRLEQAISDSKQKIDSLKQGIHDNVQIQMFAAIEMGTMEYEMMVQEMLYLNYKRHY